MELINYLEKITDEKVYLRGVNLYREQKVKNLIITSENNEEIIIKIKSNVEASNNFTKYNIFLLFSKKTLIDYSCDCIYFLNYNNFCKHLVATFLDYHSKIISSEKSNLSIHNNFSLSNLLISKYKEKSNIYFLIKNKYILNYNIVILYDKIAIELEIYNNFNKKTYKVRNIIKLLWAYIEKEIYKFTNNFIIDFKYSDFIIDKNNKKIWEILLNNQKMVDDFSIYDSDFFNGPDGFISSNQFMKILYSLKGQNINIKHKSYYNSENLINYYISEKKYNFNFKFSHNDEILNLEINNYSKLLIDDLPILIENNILYLITFDQLEIYKPIYELLKNKENKEIIFEINNLKNVAHYLLPNLKLLQNDLILPKTIEKNIINQELEVNFHLDYENNKIIIFLSFKYGNYIFNLDNNFNPELPKDYILIRNELKEKNVEEYLLMSGFKKNDNIFYLNNNDNDNYINFITKNIYELKKLGAVYYSKNFKNIKFISQPQIKIIIKNSEKNLLDFSFKINNISDHELSEIFSSINNKKEYYHLKNGSILELKDNKNNKFYKLLETLDFDLTNKKENKIKISNVNAIFLSKYLEKDNVEWENKNNYLNIFNNINNLSLNYELPIKLNAKLRNYQKFGFQWLKTLSYAKLGGILADEMGLGKTLQTITFILSEFEYNSNLEPVIIICPSSLIYNWESEINKFAPNLKVLVINGNPKKRQEMINNINNYQIIIISYSLLKKEINIFSNIKFSYSFIDEAQYIKNSNSLLSKNVKQINASIRFALTGTPIENSLSELWSIFDYCLPGYLLSHYKFQKIFEKPIINKNDQEKLTIFRDKIKPFILRRLKKDVINELPEKNIYNILIEMTDEQKKIYMSYVKTAKKELMKEFEEFGLEKTKIKILSILTRLRQICCDPSVFISNYNGGSGKIERLKNIIEENIKENKILIFSQFTTVLKNIYQKLQNNKIRALYLDGQTKIIERKNIINKFMSDDDYKIFLLSLKAGGVGLNLTKANIVIHFDPWWNPATENQATDRAHRIGQNKTVEVIRLIAKGTIEERIIDIHEKKIKLSQDIIDNNANLETLLTNLTEDEINNLLKYDF